MSNSYAQPILRTTDLAEALRVVKRLLEIADTSELEVDFEARVFSTQTLASLMELLPNAVLWSKGDDDGSPTRFPVWLRRVSMSPNIVESFLKAVGDSPATVRWDFSGWPEAPEVGLGIGGTRGAYVTLCVNVRDLDLTEPATDHTVFVHVKQIEAKRAPWLAAQVGLQVIGDLVMAPY